MLVFKARPRKNPTLDAALTSSERRMMRVLGDAMNEVRAQVIRDEGKLLDAIIHSSLDRIANLVPVEPWLAAQPVIQGELFDELVASGQRQKLPTIQKARVSFRFDAEREDAARWAEKEAGQLIVEVVQEQVNVVRDYVSRASMGEFSPAQVARGLRDTIGLTTQQAGWVENFRQREISDRMAAGATFDQAFAASEAATNRYHDRIHRYRTETIARTEILRASHEGRREAWAQGVEQGFISPFSSKQWSTEIDGRECDICGPLDGTIVDLNEEFPDGEPPIHPNCRCDVLLIPMPVDEDILEMTDEEVDSLITGLLEQTS